MIVVFLTTKMAKTLTLLTQMLWMMFGTVTDVKTFWFFQFCLFVWVDGNTAVLTFLRRVGPTITAHPSAIATGTHKLTKASSVALIWCLILK